MGKNSSIEWTDHTFNPWWGCAHVSPGCTHCYAEAWAKRVGKKVWGTESPRRFFGEQHWSEPLKWNNEAKEDSSRRRVFCASMADVFELRTDLEPWRNRLWELISQTPNLDWLLLTKRPQNVAAMTPWKETWPSNVWLGTTVEDQVRAKQRLPKLLTHPAARRFLSCEPLIGPVDLSFWINNPEFRPIDWVIAGGESGVGARPMLPTWARNLRDQCQSANIPFHFKQWGHWAPVESERKIPSSAYQRFRDSLSKEEILMEPKGKKKAGRYLDGAIWNEIPQTA
jgi:protein gp37